MSATEDRANAQWWAHRGQYLKQQGLLRRAARAYERSAFYWQRVAEASAERKRREPLRGAKNAKLVAEDLWPRAE